MGVMEVQVSQHLSPTSTEQSHSRHSLQQSPTLTTKNVLPSHVDNIILHDSTGKELEPNKLFGHTQKSIKVMAPYVDQGGRVMKNVSAAQSVTLIAGIRHVHQLLNKSMSPTTFRMKVDIFVKCVTVSSPNAKIIICSFIPSDDQESKDGAAMLNAVLQDAADSITANNVTFANTATKFVNKSQMMDGVHPKLAYMGRMARVIKDALRDRPSYTPTFTYKRQSQCSGRLYSKTRQKTKIFIQFIP